jgi:hypothetical protein
VDKIQEELKIFAVAMFNPAVSGTNDSRWIPAGTPLAGEEVTSTEIIVTRAAL